MQWGGDGPDGSGFSKGTPWIELAQNAATVNVASEDQDAESLLAWYRRLNALRHEQASLREGGFELLPTSEAGVIAWVRRGAKVAGVPSAPVVVVLNLSLRPVNVSLGAALARVGLTVAPGPLLTLAYSAQQTANGKSPFAYGVLNLPAYGTYIGELTTQRGLESVATPVKRSARRGL
jgi:glycosidase